MKLLLERTVVSDLDYLWPKLISFAKDDFDARAILL